MKNKSLKGSAMSDEEENSIRGLLLLLSFFISIVGGIFALILLKTINICAFLAYFCAYTFTFILIFENLLKITRCFSLKEIAIYATCILLGIPIIFFMASIVLPSTISFNTFIFNKSNLYTVAITIILLYFLVIGPKIPKINLRPLSN